MPRTDIAGARAVGMVTVRFAATNDNREDPQADAVISDHRNIIPTVEEILRRKKPAGVIREPKSS
jgi:hypothetical protein